MYWLRNTLCFKFILFAPMTDNLKHFHTSYVQRYHYFLTLCLHFSTNGARVCFVIDMSIFMFLKSGQCCKTLVACRAHIRFFTWNNVKIAVWLAFLYGSLKKICFIVSPSRLGTFCIEIWQYCSTNSIANIELLDSMAIR